MFVMSDDARRAANELRVAAGLPPNVKPLVVPSPAARGFAFTLATAGQLWSIAPSGMAGLRAGGGLTTRAGAALRRAADRAGAVAVIPVFGVLTQHADGWWSDVATDDLDAQLRAALADPGVAAIVLQCDSPGGAVAGVSELGARVYAARAVKPVVAIADSLMTSAAYWIGSQATEVWITPGGEVGSIGVYAVHMDHSQRLAQAGLKISLISAGRFKTEGNPFEALGGAGRSALQERLDAVDRMFRADVARGRGRGVMTLTGPAWEGRIVGAQDAKRAGLVDRIGTFTEAVGRAAALAKKGR